jgi:CxxC motif-containing protein
MSEQKFLSCPHCARGCSLDVLVDNESVTVSGNACPRGEVFGRQEAIMPMRPLMTSVRAAGGIRPRLQVCGSGDLPLARLLEAMEALDALTVAAPVKASQVVLHNLLGLGVDVVATETLPEAMP